MRRSIAKRLGGCQRNRRLADHRARLKQTGLVDEELKRVLAPVESLYRHSKEEVETYERWKRGGL